MIVLGDLRKLVVVIGDSSAAQSPFHGVEPKSESSIAREMCEKL
jgi:hypothetical protein